METRRTHFNPETGKPNPVSVKEFALMDRKEMRAFMAPLSSKERGDFTIVYRVAYDALPLATKRDIAQASVDKLSKRQDVSIADAVELAYKKMYLKRLMLPEKQPIFLRKLRIKKFDMPRWISEKKSPYLIAPLPAKA